MKTYVEFRSNQFPPYEGEEDAVNPGRWGKRVAEFLAARLPAQGFEVDQPLSMDWGWILPIVNADFPLTISIGNYDQYPDEGFLCFIEPHTPSIRQWFRKIDTQTRIEALQRALDAILSAEPAVHHIRWWTHEEFNRPGGPKY